MLACFFINSTYEPSRRILYAAVDKSTPCPMLYGAPNGVFTWPSTGKLNRKEQCGGDAAWVAANPASPGNTCKGFLHCHFFDAQTSVCERTRDMFTAHTDPCTRVAEGDQCGGDQAFVDKVRRNKLQALQRTRLEYQPSTTKDGVNLKACD